MSFLFLRYGHQISGPVELSLLPVDIIKRLISFIVDAAQRIYWRHWRLDQHKTGTWLLETSTFCDAISLYFIWNRKYIYAKDLLNFDSNSWTGQCSEPTHSIWVATYSSYLCGYNICCCDWCFWNELWSYHIRLPICVQLGSGYNWYFLWAIVFFFHVLF